MILGGAQPERRSGRKQRLDRRQGGRRPLSAFLGAPQLRDDTTQVAGGRQRDRVVKAHSPLGGGERLADRSLGRSNPRRLTNNSSQDLDPTWSPHGSEIAFVSGRDGAVDIYVMDVDGSNVRNLTNGGSTDADPAWSPDGSKIAFRSHRDGNGEIYVMNADGSDQRRLTHNDSFDGHPSWSLWRN